MLLERSQPFPPFALHFIAFPLQQLRQALSRRGCSARVSFVQIICKYSCKDAQQRVDVSVQMVSRQQVQAKEGGIPVEEGRRHGGEMSGWTGARTNFVSGLGRLSRIFTFKHLSLSRLLPYSPCPLLLLPLTARFALSTVSFYATRVSPVIQLDAKMPSTLAQTSPPLSPATNSSKSTLDTN